MTYQEALIASLQYAVDISIIQKAMIDAGINPDDVYAATDAMTIDLVAIDVLLGLLSTPDVTEGGYSIKYDRDAILARIKWLSDKWDIENPLEPRIRGIHPW